MAITDTTYYGLTRSREVSPDTRDWAVTDLNYQVISLILKAFEGHHHNATAALTYPGYYVAPAAPTLSTVGTVGTTTYSYYIVAKGLIPQQISQVAVINTGNATLTSSNKIHITWTAVPGATGYDIVRVTGGTTQGSISLNQVGTSLDDTGLAASAYTPAKQPVLTEVSTGGILGPGASIGVRIAYVNSLGLETDSCPEVLTTLSGAASKPLAPSSATLNAATPGLAGGTYLYVITKLKGSGETTISDPLPVSVPYDTTYSVTVGFDAISSYTDGTTALNVYRTTGLASTFVQVAQITASGTTTFVDTNTSSAILATTQPPTTSTFDSSKKLTIDWSALTIPAAATKLRVYVTQQPGQWSNNHLLTELDLTGTPPSSVAYLGSETLTAGWPKNSSEVPSSPTKVDLGTEATGAPILTANMDFVAFKANNMKLGDPPTTPQNGMIWYDTTTGKCRAMINGVVTDLGLSNILTNYVRTPSFEYSAFGTGDVAFGGNGAIANNWINRLGAGGNFGVALVALESVSAGSGAPSGISGLAPQGNNVLIAMSSNALNIMKITTLANAPTQLAQISEGSTLYGQVSYNPRTTGTGPNSGNALTAPTQINLNVYWYNSAGTIISNTALSTSTTWTANAWNTMFGSAVAPATTVYAAIQVTVTQALSVTSYVYFDGFAAEVNAGNAPGYFDGDFSGGFWSGPPGQSFPVKPISYTHPLKEVGGHDASHIVLGSSDLNTFVTTRYGNTDGTHKQVITPTAVIGTQNSGVDWFTASTTPADIPMSANITVTGSLATQWFETVFSGTFVVQNSGAAASFGLFYNGALIEETIRTITATTNNQAISVTIPWIHLLEDAAPKALKAQWWVTSGNLTATGTRRTLSAKLVL